MENYRENIIDINKLPKIKNGRIWYVAFLPLLACYLESFAVNIFLGAALWISVLIIGPLVCASDEKHLRTFGINNRQLYRYRFIPPVYIYKRIRITGQSNTPFIMLLIFMLYAVMNNGFVQALRITDDTFISSVKGAYVSSLSDYDEITSYNTIEDRIDKFADDDTLSWKFSKDDDYRYVTAIFKGRYKGKVSQRFDIVFRMDFDGYALKETSIDSVSVEGRKLTDSEREMILYKILIEADSSDSNSSWAEHSDYQTA